jgi:hypothetical protein
MNDYHHELTATRRDQMRREIQMRLLANPPKPVCNEDLDYERRKAAFAARSAELLGELVIAIVLLGVAALAMWVL